MAMSVTIPNAVSKFSYQLCGPLIVLVGSAYWILSSSPANTATISATIDSRSLRSGDIIFRRGPSIESQAVMAMDGKISFSHVGMVLKENGATFVIHVVPGESDSTPDVTKIEPMDVYLQPDRARAARAYRVATDHPAEIDEAVRFAKSYAERRIPFDSKFDLSSDDTLYCTELVWRAYTKAGIDLVDGRFDTLSTPFIHGKVLWPSSLLRSQHLVLAWDWDIGKEN